MSARRQARVRANITPAGVPTELFDRSSPHWSSEASAREWCYRRGVPAPVALTRPHWSPELALRSVILAWAVAAGHGDFERPQLPNQRFLVESGLARVRSECLRQGVRSLPDDEDDE